MGIKGFHLIFIFISIVLALFFAVWGYWRFGTSGASGYMIAAAVSLFVSAALAVYMGFFLRKVRSL